MMVSQITDSMLGHLQIHRRGYVASIDNLPLTLNLTANQMRRVRDALAAVPEIESWSPRIKFGGMFSNYTETTTIRLNGIDPEREFRTVPLLASRITRGSPTLAKGEIWIPDLVANGMKVSLGDTIVVVATNRDGSVNAAQLRVSGVMDPVTGPGGRDGYVHVDDATALLRMEEPEVSEVAIRLKAFGDSARVERALTAALGGLRNKEGRPVFEVHTWEGLSPFYNIAMMIDLLTLFIRVGLVAVVLISVMNVMLMSVYERVREIGTMAAMGTRPGTIRMMFVLEGLALGVVGTAVGSVVATAVIVVIRSIGPTFDFGRQTGLVLSPAIAPLDLLVVSAVVILVSALASLQPAFKASRMEPVEALRHG
jgi:putative ABC transport system permease protein